jgi:glycosyltransferase involved in cell wall biosynthesis
MIQLSIITPVYNSVQFIEFCIQNVIAQKCPDAEHIIVDGGSTDGTLEIIKKYAEQYSHIRWISEKDAGQSDAMNKGIRMANGEIISFLNADDAYFPYTLNRVMSILAVRPNYYFITGNCKVFDLDGNLMFINRPQRIKSYHLYSYQEPFPINPAAYFYRKNIHDKMGYYSMENHYNMDYEFILKVCLSYDLIYFNEDWGYAIHHAGAKTMIDTVNNEMQSRKRAVFDLLYKQCPVRVKMLANVYKLFKLISRK